MCLNTFKFVMLILVLVGSLNHSTDASVIASDTFSSEGSGEGWVAATSWGAGSVSGGQFSTSGSHYRNFENPIVATPGTSFWVLMDISIATNSWGTISFYNGSDEVLAFGRDTGHQFWGIDGAYVSDTYTTTPWVARQTVRLVGYIEYLTGQNPPGTDLSGNDRVSLWVNPADLNNLGGADAVRLDNNLGPYTRVRLGTGSSDMTIDNLIIATDLQDLQAFLIPTPAALPAGLGLMSLIGLRRRR